MSKAVNKTTENNNSVHEFIQSVENERRRNDAVLLLKLIRRITNEEAKMWGTSIVGFGKYHYKYASGREGNFMKVGFSPRKASMTIYIMPGFERYSKILERLGKHKISKSCLYIKPGLFIRKSIPT